MLPARERHGWETDASKKAVLDTVALAKDKADNAEKLRLHLKRKREEAEQQVVTWTAAHLRFDAKAIATLNAQWAADCWGPVATKAARLEAQERPQPPVVETRSLVQHMQRPVDIDREVENPDWMNDVIGLRDHFSSVLFRFNMGGGRYEFATFTFAKQNPWTFSVCPVVVVDRRLRAAAGARPPQILEKSVIFLGQLY